VRNDFGDWKAAYKLVDRSDHDTDWPLQPEFCSLFEFEVRIGGIATYQNAARLLRIRWRQEPRRETGCVSGMSGPQPAAEALNNANATRPAFAPAIAPRMKPNQNITAPRLVMRGRSLSAVPRQVKRRVENATNAVRRSPANGPKRAALIEGAAALIAVVR
jgi:hypothetical protein